MALPLNNTPVYNLEIPSNGKQVKYRPFLVKEEKALLIAQQSEDPKVMIDSLKEVISACVKDEIDVDSLATFDLEYVFLQIRAKSVGENVDLFLKCDTCTDEKALAKITLNLTEINVEKNPSHTNKIALFGDVGIALKYPSIDIVKKIETVNVKDYDKLFDIVIDCIDYIYTDKEVFNAKDQSKAELKEFIDSLTSNQFELIQHFFETIPKLKKEISYNCPVCNKLHNKTLEGLNSFF